MAGWIKMPLGMEVGLVPSEFVLDGHPAPSSTKKGAEPQLSAHVYCGQMAGWIKMAHGMKVGLSPDHIVLDGDPSVPPLKGHSPNFRPMSVVAKRRLRVRWDSTPPEKRHSGPHPIFGPCLLWPNGWMDEDTTW